MTSLFHSGKFWLKLIFIGFTTLLTLFLFAAIGLHYLFNTERVYQHAHNLMAQTGHKVDFSQNISRSWFPRPTVTLHQVRIYSEQHHYNELTIDEMKIGLSWQALFGRSIIEKWQWHGVNADLFRDSKGNWNLNDLWQSIQPKYSKWKINRLVVENATLRIRDGQKNQLLSNVEILLKHFSTSEQPIQAKGIWQSAGFSPIQWQLKTTHAINNLWRNTQLNLQTEETSLGKSDSQWNFDAQWLPQKQVLQTGTVQWRWQSQNHNIHANGIGQNWQFGWSTLTLPQLSAIITANHQNDNTFNASFSANNTSLTKNQLSIKQFQLDCGWQDQSHQSSLSVGGQLNWLDNHTWQINDLTLTSHQDSLNGLPSQRFISELSGNLINQIDQNTTLQLQGQFDNQPVNIDMVYQSDSKNPTLKGKIQLAQLNLRPYLQDIKLTLDKNGIDFWKKWIKSYSLDWQLNIDHIISNSLQLHQLNTHLTADRNQLNLSPINLQLYDGSGQGQFHLATTPALSWKLEQHFQNIQIRPFLQDIFNFHNIDGQGDAQIQLTSQGLNSQQWLNSLNGKVDLQLKQGLLRGIDINNILQNKNTNTIMPYNETSQTPFRLLKLSIPIKKGISQDGITALTADNFNIKGQGNLNLPEHIIDYMILISTYRNNEQTLLPLRISGAITHPNFSLDYQRLTAGLHTPEQKQESLRQTLKQQWLWLNQGASSEMSEWSAKP